jgi:hypothetical protein
MAKLIAKYPLLALILIWATLVGAVWLLPSEPRPQGLATEHFWLGTLPPGMAAVHRLIIARHRLIAD